MTAKPKARKDIRTTVSLARVVWDVAMTMMRDKGFNDNFSAYIADLIRRDLERSKSGAATFPPVAARSSRLELNET